MAHLRRAIKQGLATFPQVTLRWMPKQFEAGHRDNIVFHCNFHVTLVRGYVWLGNSEYFRIFEIPRELVLGCRSQVSGTASSLLFVCCSQQKNMSPVSSLPEFLGLAKQIGRNVLVASKQSFQGLRQGPIHSEGELGKSICCKLCFPPESLPRQGWMLLQHPQPEPLSN